MKLTPQAAWASNATAGLPWAFLGILSVFSQVEGSIARHRQVGGDVVYTGRPGTVRQRPRRDVSEKQIVVSDPQNKGKQRIPMLAPIILASSALALVLALALLREVRLRRALQVLLRRLLEKLRSHRHE